MVDVRFHMVVIDCSDPRSLATFWEGFTGYERRSDEEDWVSIYSPDDSMRIGFQQVPEGKVVKNRVHIDFSATDEEATAKEIEAMGATRRWVGEDPEDPSSYWPIPRATSSASCASKRSPSYSVSRSAPRLGLFEPVTDGLTTKK